MRRHNVLLKYVFFVSTVCWWSPINAADDAVYESLDDVQIGSVFFSPKDREQLDRKRLLTGNVKTQVSQNAGSSGRRHNRDAAGYIIGRSGQEKVYFHGDFIAAEQPSSVVFPRDVEIKKSISLPQPSNSDDDSDSLDPADEDD